MKSESSLHTEKQGDEARESLAFGVSFGWGTGRARFWSIVVTGAYLRFKMDYNTHEWSDFILMPRVGAMGMQERGIKGAYMNSKHRVGKRITV